MQRFVIVVRFVGFVTTTAVEGALGNQTVLASSTDSIVTIAIVNRFDQVVMVDRKAVEGIVDNSAKEGARAGVNRTTTIESVSGKVYSAYLIIVKI